jgi:hypothetical protein
MRLPIPDTVFYCVFMRQKTCSNWHSGESYEDRRDAEIQLERNRKLNDSREYRLIEKRTIHSDLES